MSKNKSDQNAHEEQVFNDVYSASRAKRLTPRQRRRRQINL